MFEKQRPFKSSEVKNILVWPQSKYFFLRDPPWCYPVPLRVTSDPNSWHSLDTLYESHYCCGFYIDYSRNTHPKAQSEVFGGGRGEKGHRQSLCLLWAVVLQTSIESETVHLTLHGKDNQVELGVDSHDKDEEIKHWL